MVTPPVAKFGTSAVAAWASGEPREAPMASCEGKLSFGDQEVRGRLRRLFSLALASTASRNRYEADVIAAWPRLARRSQEGPGFALMRVRVRDATLVQCR